MCKTGVQMSLGDVQNVFCCSAVRVGRGFQIHPLRERALHWSMCPKYAPGGVQNEELGLSKMFGTHKPHKPHRPHKIAVGDGGSATRASCHLATVTGLAGFGAFFLKI